MIQNNTLKLESGTVLQSVIEPRVDSISEEQVRKIARRLIQEKAETMVDQLFYLYRKEIEELVDGIPEKEEEEELKVPDLPKLKAEVSMEFEDSLET